jgi:radical SAM protein with 4Fe4S-binding SPASM domain
MSEEGPALEPESVDLYDQIELKTQKTRRLFRVLWELTHRCTERCVHCYLDVLPPGAHIAGELTTDECFRIIDELSEAGVLNLTFTGGEILARRDFFQIAEYAHSKRFLVRLFTNGVLITPKVADRLAALHVHSIEISIYGADAETHERVTRLPRSFKLSTRALRLLRERGVRTVLKTPLMHHNVHQFQVLESLARELGASFAYGITLSPQHSGNPAPLEYRLTDDDLAWLFREFLDPTPWLKRTVTDDQHVCKIATNAITIDPYGNVFPCGQAHIAAGNLREQPLRDIWETSPLWDELLSLTWNELPVCRTCGLRTLCGHCHGQALLEGGDLRGPSFVNCHEAMARRQVLIEKGLLPADYPIPAHLQPIELSIPAPIAQLAFDQGR